MKIIELLNKIANGEEVPKKVRFAGIIFEYDEDDQMYNNYEHENICDYAFLNDEVEIIEEEKKIEKIDVIPYEKCIHEVTHKEKEILLEIRDIQMKVNKIIDCLMENKDV